ncbi:MAG: cobalamin-dependent protein [Bdellovibrionota bacterium]
MPVKILLAKPGLDVHDRGIRMIARACREAGMEVVYLGSGIQTVEQCVDAAVQEDVDVLGLSIMTGAPETMCKDAVEALRKRKAADIPLLVGGVIRQDQKPAIESLGVAGVFAAGSSLTEILARIEQVASERGRKTRQAL